MRHRKRHGPSSGGQPDGRIRQCRRCKQRSDVLSVGRSGDGWHRRHSGHSIRWSRALWGDKVRARGGDRGSRPPGEWEAYSPSAMRSMMGSCGVVVFPGGFGLGGARADMVKVVREDGGVGGRLRECRELVKQVLEWIVMK